VKGVFERFVHSEVSGSALLLVCTAAALGLANSSFAEVYVGLLYTKVGLSWGDAKFALTVQHWINDLLMVVFFFVVGLEIKRELLVGQLSSAKKALLPVMAALGGMVVPALLYASFNAGGEGAGGWGIPMATDIAFALGVLALFGTWVPIGLKVFLTALAIVDDLGAVLVALLVPIGARRDPQDFLSVSDARLAELRVGPLTPDSMVSNRSQFDAISDLHKIAGDMRPPGLALEEMLHPFVVFFVLPLFALFNAGVAIDGGFVDGLLHPVSLGILAGLVLGKQVGIVLFSWIAVKSGQADLPDGVGWSHIYGGACIAGIGFTMSLFVTELAFTDVTLLARAKVGILVASLVAALWGAVLLQMRLPRAHAGRA